MKVLVCGGRDYGDEARLRQVLDAMHGVNNFTCLVNGAGRGADLLAEAWARDNEIKYVGIPAEWKKLDKKAGPIRNQRMLDEERPGMAIAFPGNKGTGDMLSRCQAAGMAPKFPASPDGIIVLYA
jgi:hypothetical protein